MQHLSKKRRKLSQTQKKNYQLDREGQNQQQPYQIDQKFNKPVVQQVNQCYDRTGTLNHLKVAPEDQTVTGESVDQLAKPYQFLIFAKPPIHTIFLPHFTVKSVTFVLTIIFIICYVILMIYSYTKPFQNSLTWNCSIFQLQNKYYPRIRYQFQLWRILISFFFHSNYIHVILNLIGVQIYGYFVQWYIGRVRYVATLVLSLIVSHLLSCICQTTTVSTTSSSALFAIFALKLYFLYEYKDYKLLLNRRPFLYSLFIIIFGVNLLPIFVDNNVDYAVHIAGFITGGLMALFINFSKEQQPTKFHIAFKFGSVILIGCAIIICFVIIYTLSDSDGTFKFLNDNIQKKCSNPQQ